MRNWMITKSVSLNHKKGAGKKRKTNNVSVTFKHIYVDYIGEELARPLKEESGCVFIDVIPMPCGQNDVYYWLFAVI